MPHGKTPWPVKLGAAVQFLDAEKKGTLPAVTARFLVRPPAPGEVTPPCDIYQQNAGDMGMPDSSTPDGKGMLGKKLWGDGHGAYIFGGTCIA